MTTMVAVTRTNNSTTGALRRARRISFLERRDGPGCFYCKKLLTPVEITLDHVIPRSKGGSDGLWNLVIACVDCNQAKADAMPEDLPEGTVRLLRIDSRSHMKCTICKNGRRIPDNDAHCWACMRPNLNTKRPVSACHHTDSWCVGCVATA